MTLPNNYVEFSNDINDYAPLERTIYPGMLLSNETEEAGDFIRGEIDTFVPESVHRCYVKQAVSLFYPETTYKVADIILYVRFGGFDLAPATNWISFMTTGLNADWSRVITVNYTENAGLHMTHVPDQGDSIQTVHNFQSMNQGQWYKIRNLIDLINGTSAIWCNDTLVASATINTPSSWDVWNFHFGFYSYGMIETGYMDNKDLIIGCGDQIGLRGPI